MTVRITYLYGKLPTYTVHSKEECKGDQDAVAWEELWNHPGRDTIILGKVLAERLDKALNFK